MKIIAYCPSILIKHPRQIVKLLICPYKWTIVSICAAITSFDVLLYVGALKAVINILTLPVLMEHHVISGRALKS